eukprot:gene3230-3710_t
MDFSFCSQQIPVVLQESPQPSPTSSVEPLDLQDIGDLPVKLELRYAIESRRNERGLDMPVLYDKRKTAKPNLTYEEEEKRIIRRQRNKVAASKCRVKRKNHVKTLLEQSDELTRSNNQLEAEIAELRKEKDKLMEALRTHMCMKHQQAEPQAQVLTCSKCFTFT